MIISWKEIAIEIYDKLNIEVFKIWKKPTLGAILVGENSSSLRYIAQKQKWADYIWINFKLEKLDKNISEKDLLSVITNFNNDNDIDWYLVQLPLPNHINETNIINSISYLKDVDGFHPVNMWKLVIWDDTGFISCTPAWILELLDNQKIEYRWKQVVVIGRSNIVWKPVTNLLINKWATVISCNSQTPSLTKFTIDADIVIVATWKPWLLTSDMIKPECVIIDVWFTIIDWKIYWDADTEMIDKIWAKITPVPWWVWALTVAMLMKNTIKASIKN